jgi:threonine dehydratase
MAAREVMAAQVQAATGARLVHPFTDPRVIAGQGTAAVELANEIANLAAVLTPIGGGGLICGTAIALSGCATGARVFAAEPEGADEAWQSLQRGARVSEHNPETICDGLRGTLGEINFALLRQYGVDILRVSDAETLAAQRLLGERMKIVVEPSSAIVLAAVLRYRERFAGQRLGLILTGGNVE